MSVSDAVLKSRGCVSKMGEWGVCVQALLAADGFMSISLCLADSPFGTRCCTSLAKLVLSSATHSRHTTNTSTRCMSVCMCGCVGRCVGGWAAGAGRGGGALSMNSETSAAQSSCHHQQHRCCRSGDAGALGRQEEIWGWRVLVRPQQPANLSPSPNKSALMTPCFQSISILTRSIDAKKGKASPADN